MEAIKPRKRAVNPDSSVSPPLASILSSTADNLTRSREIASNTYNRSRKYIWGNALAVRSCNRG
jgi:hypothetical protein